MQWFDALVILPDRQGGFIDIAAPVHARAKRHLFEKRAYCQLIQMPYLALPMTATKDEMKVHIWAWARQHRKTEGG